MAKIGPIDAPLIPTIILVTGGYVMWFAVHYWRDVEQVYPSGPVKALLTGKGMPAPVREGSPQDPNAATGAGADLGQLIANAGDTAIQVEGGGSGGSALGDLTGNGKIFSQAEMEQFWIQNGGDPSKARFAAGVVNAESGGNSEATSSNPDGGTNVGLFQLDTRGVGAGHTVQELMDPTLNTTITIMATRNGTDWSDWADPWITEYGTSGNM